MRLCFLHIIVPLLFVATPALAQRVDSYASVDSVTVGDRFELSVVVGHDGSRTALFPHDMLPDSLKISGAVFALGDFEILKVISQGGRPYDLGGRIDSVIYEATTFALDTARVAGIAVGLAEGGDTLLAMSPGVMLSIGSLVPEDATELKDIAPIATFERSWWPWILGLLAFTAAAYGLWWFRKKGQFENGDLDEGAEPVIAPYNEAVQRLSALQSMDLSLGDNIKPFYVELTDILRTYVGRRANVPALESTTAELLEKLKQSQARSIVPGDIIAEIDRVLSHADMVKFADLRPVLEEARAIVAETREAIEGTESAFRIEDDRIEEERRERLEETQYAPPGVEVEENQ